MTQPYAPGAHMRAEIFEQPEALARLLERASAVLSPVARAARNCAFAVLAARGSSDNASIYGKYLLEGQARIPTALAAPSLFTLYDTPPRLAGALVVGVSQSGAAADVIAVLEAGQRQGALTLAITNTPGSPITAAAEHVLLLDVGPERALAATKTVTAQCAAYAGLVAAMQDNAALKQHLHHLPHYVRNALSREPLLTAWVPSLFKEKRLAVIGRGYAYGAAHEIALKLKETCFISAHAYSAADFLHGPLALIEPGYPVIILLNHDETQATTIQVIARILERGGRIFCLATSPAAAALPAHPRLNALVVDAPSSLLSPIAFIAVGQLLALNLSLQLGHNPDQSRGVSKVTVTK
ncbi:MAG: SIS domain-containing protein [Chloroflexi bacterium]|jgi:glucosamine--fructose-6-phosphate aminotransferase (isomerizing)|uniref:Glucosamine--fructose-6-phosphate aminotransferase n=1 Tax=Candidatus Thermofonsia Clade 3 bacterium TaxID=2364212 RepID=A0A2M8QCC7_9CHLR|nr:SIS domain-containing protein [Candidatus Roseilinea sp. NK_OTU-006]PJF47457.1 MAG: glucosamine--fructose-6-phosphate aminotransferase [Candidatus Thermofonsia Clade 3 bacterium]RMG65340.1 MAG: SIS domain-containing protein [Chloroflexota bacterium]